MLEDQACEELAAILINIVESAPKNLVPNKIKRQVGASHSLITANIKISKKEVEEAIKRFHYWMHLWDIGESAPENAADQD